MGGGKGVCTRDGTVNVYDGSEICSCCAVALEFHQLSRPVISVRPWRPSSQVRYAKLIVIL